MKGVASTRTFKSLLPAVLLFGATACTAAAPTGVDLHSLLNTEFFLGGERSDELRYYEMETKVTTLTPDGQPAESVTYGLLLSATPAPGDDELDAIMTGDTELRMEL